MAESRSEGHSGFERDSTHSKDDAHHDSSREKREIPVFRVQRSAVDRRTYGKRVAVAAILARCGSAR